MNNPFGFGDLGKLKDSMQQLQDKMKTTTATGEAGAGMVTVTINGLMEVQSVHIDKELMTAEDQHTVEVLIASAFSDAMAKIKASTAQQVMGGGFGV